MTKKEFMEAFELDIRYAMEKCLKTRCDECKWRKVKTELGCSMLLYGEYLYEQGYRKVEPKEKSDEREID